MEAASQPARYCQCRALAAHRELRKSSTRACGQGRLRAVQDPPSSQQLSPVGDRPIGVETGGDHTILPADQQASPNFPNFFPLHTLHRSWQPVEPSPLEIFPIAEDWAEGDRGCLAARGPEEPQTVLWWLGDRTGYRVGSLSLLPSKGASRPTTRITTMLRRHMCSFWASHALTVKRSDMSISHADARCCGAQSVHGQRVLLAPPPRAVTTACFWALLAGLTSHQFS
ncbi:hypothetical protein B0T14DRAFT_32164 [Immersiella caudata]|uniref:Uncharacterized protein n=1 Tax=Immersiella caudata TaxID=314043 RepID=A0AA40CB92_9PEZI|nr:hypothetical protein B0T14DRAFT_32164 [Immersiella caudata]